MDYQALSPVTGHSVVISVVDGRISTIVPSACDSDDGLWVAPGFVDLQVNGFAGVDYNSPETSIDKIGCSIDAQRTTGVTRLYPTIITGSNTNIRKALTNLARAKHELSNGTSIAGLHLEGPWISPHDGPRGAHPIEHVRAASIAEFEDFQGSAEGQIRLVTIAPEVEGALALIEYLSDQGVVVSLGHTGANAEEIHAAVDAGATMSTHLGNASYSMTRHNANHIIEQMACDQLYAGFIVDGIHLPPSFVKVAIRAKTPEKSILVTDAVAPAGCNPGSYRLGHLEVQLSDDGSVRLVESGRLAGSALRMDYALNNLMRFSGLSLAKSLATATVNPARAIGLEGRQGFLIPGELADLVLFQYNSETLEIKIIESVV